MELPEILAPLYAELAPTLTKVVEESATLRDAVRGGSVEEDPEALHERLLLCRASLDRVETIMAGLGRLKAKTAQAVQDLQDEYDDAYSGVVTNGHAHAHEFSTGKEREASYSLKLMDHTIKLRRAKRAHRDVEATHEYVRTLFWGIDGTRKDLDTRLRLIMLAGQLEH